MVDIKVEAAFEKLLTNHVNLSDAHRHHPDFDGTVRDVRDGSLWRDHPLSAAAALGGFIGWMFLLYIDEAEMSCPIGAFRGKRKYMFGYWVLLNLSYQHRWKLCNIQLAFICLADLFSHYGACAVISGDISSFACPVFAVPHFSSFSFWLSAGKQNPDGTWVDDTSFMASMERFANGVIIPELHATQKQYGALLIVLGDGKALAEMAETKKAVSKVTERICRLCNCTSERRAEVHSMLDPACPFLLTTPESHERDRKLVVEHDGAPRDLYSKLLGQSGQPHAFSRSLSFLSFDITGGLPGNMPLCTLSACTLFHMKLPT